MEIYVGFGFRYPSERVLLREIGRAVARAAQDAIVLANVNLSDRQVDFVPCLEQRAIVLEAKAYTCPVRVAQWTVGGADSDWDVEGGR